MDVAIRNIGLSCREVRGRNKSTWRVVIEILMETYNRRIGWPSRKIPKRNVEVTRGPGGNRCEGREVVAVAS